MRTLVFGLLAATLAVAALQNFGEAAPSVKPRPTVDKGLQKKFLSELAGAGLPEGPGSEAVVTEAEIAALPEPARRFMRFMGVVGRPRVWSFRGQWQGLFRAGLKRDWAEVVAEQYNSRLEPARYFMIHMNWIGPLTVTARDTYMQGRGRMHGKFLDLFTVVDATGPEFDIGELVTYLNDAVILAPSMLLGPDVKFIPVDEHAFDLSLTDKGTTVTARVFIDHRGAVTDFSTTDRFFSDPSEPDKPLTRTRWTTPIKEWGTFEGRPVPIRGEAVWHLPQGPFTYADMGVLPESLAYNVKPGQ